MTELREPPLLSDKEVAIGSGCVRYLCYSEGCRLCLYRPHCFGIAQAQREADIKWMKEHCHIKAERELPDIISFLEQIKGGQTVLSLLYEDELRRKFKAFMLKEVDGIAYRACEEFKDAK